MSNNLNSNIASVNPSSSRQSSSEPRKAGTTEVRAIFKEFSADLKRVEQQIASTFESDSKALSEISAYLLDLGGKRIRPLLTLISARLFGAEQIPQSVVKVASGIELIHMATLLHDDIIDKSPTRRGKKSAFKKFGQDATLLTGDFLFARAFGLCGLLDDFTIQATEKACVALIEGENLEGIIDIKKQRPVSEYITVIEKKTAALFALACQVGSHLSGADAQASQQMYDFGLSAGISFQIIDDILDIVADEDLLGKKSGSDLRQGTPSIVNILWLDKDPEFSKDFFANNRSSDEKLLKEAISRIKSSSILDQSRELAISYLSSAENYLDELPNSLAESKDAENLRTILAFTFNRVN